MNRIKKIVEWVEENPEKAMVAVVSVAVASNLVYFVYAMKLDRERTQIMRDVYANQKGKK